ncbi:hypothetical protein HDU76_006799 [Blyttiomyces sp. JEL0837]|nr:hypothetical protein HDU76_006799 [Blyttiomyces sp. JEL0837]
MPKGRVGSKGRNPKTAKGSGRPSSSSASASTTSNPDSAPSADTNPPLSSLNPSSSSLAAASSPANNPFAELSLLSAPAASSASTSASSGKGSPSPALTSAKSSQSNDAGTSTSAPPTTTNFQENLSLQGLSLQDQPISSTSASPIQSRSKFRCGEDVLPIYGKVLGGVADDSESEAESGDEEIVDGTDLDKVRRVVVERQEMMTNNLQKKEWAVEPSPFHDKRFMFKHKTASKITHKSLHLSIYSNLERLGGFDELAKLLGVPLEGLEDICDRVWSDKNVQHYFKKFRHRSDDTPEDQVQSSLDRLCMAISIVLEGQFNIPRPDNVPHRTVVVGGFMALSNYDYRSVTDFLVTHDETGKVLLSTEVKTNKTFPEEHLWYRGSRGPQVSAALYGYNAVTFLVTPKQWKLFVENVDRNTIRTMPFDDAGQDKRKRPHVCGKMGENFVKALTICLLPRVNPTDGTTTADELVAVGVGGDPNKASEIVRLAESITLTVQKETSHSDHISAAKPPPPKFTKRSTSGGTATSPSPKFPVGVDEAGETIWQEIIVWTPEQVAELLKRQEEERLARRSEEELRSRGENELADDGEDKMGMKAETAMGSDQTLNEEDNTTTNNVDILDADMVPVPASTDFTETAFMTAEWARDRGTLLVTQLGARMMAMQSATITKDLLVQTLRRAQRDQVEHAWFIVAAGEPMMTAFAEKLGAVPESVYVRDRNVGKDEGLFVLRPEDQPGDGVDFVVYAISRAFGLLV